MIGQILAFFLPWGLRRRVLSRFCGFSIDPTARIGFSVIKARQVILGPHARIGHLTFIKGISRLELGEHALLGNLNWVTAVPEGNPHHYKHLPDRKADFTIERHAAVTHRHMIDCTGSVRIGAFTTVAGWYTQFISHSFDFRRARQDAQPIDIGSHAFVGSRCVVLKGARLPDKCVLSAGSVFDGKDAGGEHGLFRGNPAVREGELPADLGYFTRKEGFIE